MSGSGVPTTYRPTWESLSAHQVPAWFDDAKLGVFLHWGLYSVPGWAPQVRNIQDLLRDHGPTYLLRNSPYAEWYRNTMQIEGSPTQRHHAEVYGTSFGYDDFRTEFEAASAGADLDALAGVCREAGARYVVLTTKHHDGYCLWPPSRPHPRKGAYHSPRDLVGDLSDAVRAAGMRMGLYYSGGYDWPFNDAVIRHAADVILATPPGEDYQRYATEHVRELVDRYRPSVLWNDICWPPGGDLAALFAHYYNTVPDGVVNDRWVPSVARRPGTEAVIRAGGWLLERLWRFIPAERKELTFPNPRPHDFDTPEYSSFEEIRTEKWEATRGIGHSFGANRNERPGDILSTGELVRSFVDIVSKNGNLLIGLGPRADGTIPDEQREPVSGLGRWLGVNGEAMFGSRPWARPAGSTDEKTGVRFTVRDGTLYVTLLGAPGRRSLGFPDLDATGVASVRVLGVDEEVSWRVDGRLLTVDLPERLPVSPAHVIAVSPVPSPVVTP